MEELKNFDIKPLLERERVSKIFFQLEDHAKKFGGRFPEDDEGHAKYLVKKYSYCTSVLIGLLGDDVAQKRILEVGPGYAGRFMLDYLVKEGADAVGTDPYCDYTDYLGISKGRYVSTAMEDLPKTFPPESIDLINIMAMYSDPCPLEIKKMQRLGNFFEKIKSNRYYRRYDSKLSESIDFVLKKGGYLTLWYRFYGDFELNPDTLKKKGFNHISLYSFDFKIPGMFNLDIYQKS